MASWRKAPRSGQCGLWCRPFGFSTPDAWKVAAPIHTWGSCIRATRGYSRRPAPQVRSPNAFTNRQLLFVKHWCNQQRVRFGLDGGFAAACAKMLAYRPRLHGVNNSKQARRGLSRGSLRRSGSIRIRARPGQRAAAPFRWRRPARPFEPVSHFGIKL